MSETLHQSVKYASDDDLDSDVRRAYAVAAALEVISSKASGADSTSLKIEFSNLSTYADQIQEALKVK
ncbi:hypothetical protein [Pseudomonas capsici]|uniref:hypothetical protein n=1 Tax=Pseudomonas capsici TaxID=2810614 RepID=UPI0021F0ACF4|nr:hypothetical protein [Pseudomonas capsici]MCV4285083.1 hypothetical protein [Pseudomonas capsici]